MVEVSYAIHCCCCGHSLSPALPGCVKPSCGKAVRNTLMLSTADLRDLKSSLSFLEANNRRSEIRLMQLATSEKADMVKQ
jgi:hypothetical protein